MVPEIHVITAPMETIPTAGVSMIEIMIVTVESKRALPAARCKIPVVDPKLPVFVPNLTREIDLVGHYRFVAPR